MIVCGDLGLLWAKGESFEQDCEFFAKQSFTLLWVQGNHENYNMIDEYPVEKWHGGKVRHIVRDKVILLERGQVFDIEGKRYFTFGGAQSHDISGGVLDKDDPLFEHKYNLAMGSGRPFRILNTSWWKQELPTDTEIEEARVNLESCDYKVDYVITHCASNTIQLKLEDIKRMRGRLHELYAQNILTENLNIPCGTSDIITRICTWIRSTDLYIMIWCLWYGISSLEIANIVMNRSYLKSQMLKIT